MSKTVAFFQLQCNTLGLNGQNGQFPCRLQRTAPLPDILWCGKVCLFCSLKTDKG